MNMIKTQQNIHVIKLIADALKMKCYVEKMDLLI